MEVLNEAVQEAVHAAATARQRFIVLWSGIFVAHFRHLPVLTSPKGLCIVALDADVSCLSRFSLRNCRVRAGRKRLGEKKKGIFKDEIFSGYLFYFNEEKSKWKKKNRVGMGVAGRGVAVVLPGGTKQNKKKIRRSSSKNFQISLEVPRTNKVQKLWLF